MYVMPEPTDLYTWHGVMFIHAGLWKEAVFKFTVHIPPTYPHAQPRVVLASTVFHPLVAADGQVHLGTYEDWKPRRHVLAT
jgi:ubiquitin-protein ligase